MSGEFLSEISQTVVRVYSLAVEEPPMPRLDRAVSEDIPHPPLENEGEVGATIRPSLPSGYSKQFQKSLPPRFLRQQVFASRRESSVL